MHAYAITLITFFIRNIQNNRKINRQVVQSIRFSMGTYNTLTLHEFVTRYCGSYKTKSPDILEHCIYKMHSTINHIVFYISQYQQIGSNHFVHFLFNDLILFSYAYNTNDVFKFTIIYIII